MSKALLSSIKTSKVDLNLQTLQRLDAAVTDVRFTLSFCVVYTTTAASAWEKMDVEGTLFVVARAQDPVYMVKVLNRNGINRDFEFPITATLSIDRNQDKYVLHAFHTLRVSRAPGGCGGSVCVLQCACVLCEFRLVWRS